MDLSKETIRGLTVGAAEIWEEQGCLCFSKTTAEQTAAWATYAPRLEERVRATTGVRLDFITDSPFIRVVTAGGCKFEVLIDGLLSERYCPASEAPSFGEPITVYDSSSRGADSYRMLAAELMQKHRQ